MNQIILITKCNEKINDYHARVGLLIECANDSHLKKTNPDAIPKEKLIGKLEDGRRFAGELTEKLLAKEPYYRGVRQLSIFKESIALELHKVYHLIQLHDYIQRENIEICQFLSASWWGKDLKKLAMILGSSLQVRMPIEQQSNKLTRCINRITSAKFSLSAIILEVKRALNQLDPFHRRYIWLNKFKKNSHKKNKIWFYTTAVNYTNIALAYEQYMSENFEYLVEDPLTGGQFLQTKKRHFHDLYRYAKLSFIPKHKEINEITHELYQYLMSVPLTATESIAREFLMKSDWLADFNAVFLAKGLFSSSIFENWINEATPLGLVVGNPGYEAHALDRAKDYHIPTALLQHGVVTNYHKYMDFPVDYYIVRGKFFYDRLSASGQKRALELNPSFTAKSDQIQHKDSIIFITGPLQMRHMTFDVDIDLILLNLISSMDRAQKIFYKLVIRVHPLERIIDYKNKVKKILKNLNTKLDIEFTQGKELHSELSKASAAIIFGSTVFLDCINAEVPMITFDWIDFGFNDTIKPYDMFYFAKNLEHFNVLIKQAMNGELKLSLENANQFLAKTKTAEIAQQFQTILSQPKKVLYV